MLVACLGGLRGIGAKVHDFHGRRHCAVLLTGGAWLTLRDSRVAVRLVLVHVCGLEAWFERLVRSTGTAVATLPWLALQLQLPTMASVSILNSGAVHIE